MEKAAKQEIAVRFSPRGGALALAYFTVGRFDGNPLHASTVEESRAEIARLEREPELIVELSKLMAVGDDSLISQLHAAGVTDESGSVLFDGKTVGELGASAPTAPTATLPGVSRAGQLEIARLAQIGMSAENAVKSGDIDKVLSSAIIASALSAKRGSKPVRDEAIAFISQFDRELLGVRF